METSYGYTIFVLVIVFIAAAVVISVAIGYETTIDELETRPVNDANTAAISRNRNYQIILAVAALVFVVIGAISAWRIYSMYTAGRTIRSSISNSAALGTVPVASVAGVPVARATKLKPGVVQPKYDRATLVNSRGQKGTVYIPEPCANQITTNDPNQFLPQAPAGMQAGFLNPVTKEFTPTTGIQYTGLSSTGQLVQQGVVNPSFTNPVRPGIVQQPQGQFAGQPIGGNVVGVIDPDFSGQRNVGGGFQQGFQGFQPGFVGTGTSLQQAKQIVQQAVAEDLYRQGKGVDPNEVVVTARAPTYASGVVRQTENVNFDAPTSSSRVYDPFAEMGSQPATTPEGLKEQIVKRATAAGPQGQAAAATSGFRTGIGTTSGIGTIGGTGGMEDTNPEIWALINNTGAGVPGRV